MAFRAPRPSLAIITVVSTSIFFALAVWGWGGWSTFIGHPARSGTVVATVVMVAVALFLDVKPFNPGKREDTRNRWIFLPFLLGSLLLGWAPAYTDRHDVWTIDGDLARYSGLALFVIGGALRLGAVVTLGRYFTGLVAIQPDHRLVTTGLFAWVRHPSYLGLIVNVAGWALVFRSALGLLIVLGFILVLVARMNAEEALLLSEFGEEYAAYRRRTWRLLPFVY